MAVVNVKLASVFLKFRPENISDNPFELAMPNGSSAADLIAALNILPTQRLMVIVNSELVPVDKRSTYLLQDADNVSLVPLIQAG